MEEKDLRSRRKVVRFSQEFLIHLAKEYGDLPKNAELRGVKEDFDTSDIIYKVVCPDWRQVSEGAPSGRIDITFTFPKETINST